MSFISFRRWRLYEAGDADADFSMEGSETSPLGMTTFFMSYSLLVMLPGPNMAIAVRAGLTMSHSDRMKTVVGIALGASVLVTLATLPMMAFPHDGSIHRVAPIAAGLVLVGLGLRMFLRSRTSPLEVVAHGAGSGFGIAFMTALSNPTTALYFASSSLSVANLPLAFRAISMATIVFAVAAVWFSLVISGLHCC